MVVVHHFEKVMLAWVALAVGEVSGQAPAARASEPHVAFDFARVAQCTEVPSAEDTLLYQDEKLVELRLRISVHLLKGNIRDVEEIRVEVADSDSRMRVQSFSPSTQLASRLNGDIEWSKTTEETSSLGASLGGELPAPVGDLIAHVTPTVSGGNTSHEKIVEKQLRMAPRFAVVASGTIDQEHGVFFKLRSSPQSSLEGTHELIIRFVVPRSWRGDSLRVCCQATGTEKVLWMKQQTTWSHTCRPLAVYLAGDVEARQAALRYITGARERS